MSRPSDINPPPPPYTGSCSSSTTSSLPSPSSPTSTPPTPMRLHLRTLTKTTSLLFHNNNNTTTTPSKPTALYTLTRTKRHFWSRTPKSNPTDLQLTDCTTHNPIGTIHFHHDRHGQKITLTFPQTGHDIELVSGVFQSKHGNGGVEDDTVVWTIDDVVPPTNNSSKSRNASSSFSTVLTARTQETARVICRITMSGNNGDTASLEIVDAEREKAAVEEIVVSGVAEMERWRRLRPSLIRRVTRSLTMTF